MSTQNTSSLPFITTTLAGSFAELGEKFFTRVNAKPLPNPYLVAISNKGAEQLGLEPENFSTPSFLNYFSGNKINENQKEAPIATVYSGHQFGVWAGQLGDGRALLLGEIEHNNKRYEVQLKGSGITPYSRMGDGRAVLRASLREFLCSEAMHFLGIPTTRALCVMGSDLPVIREEIETAAVTTRFASSFIRFGHFEHFASLENNELERRNSLKQLADHVIKRHYSECHNEANIYLSFFNKVVENTAKLIAHWQAIGFCHGVMNTDNMSILGLTIDYGPFAFLDKFDANHICNHSDETGRYTYQNQPHIAFWNLKCLAQALIPIIDDEKKSSIEKSTTIERLQMTLNQFSTYFNDAFLNLMRAKLGLNTAYSNDNQLINQLFSLMQKDGADFTLTFRNLSSLCQLTKKESEIKNRIEQNFGYLFTDLAAFSEWVETYQTRLLLEDVDSHARAKAMNQVNPKFILRNYLAEIAIQAAQQKDFTKVKHLLKVLSKPFDEQLENEAYAKLPPKWAASLSISCSS